MNLYEPHNFMINSGTFWRCSHGHTGWNKTCWRCGLRHPLEWLKHWWELFTGGMD